MFENRFLSNMIAALENQEPTDEIMSEASGMGKPDLPAQTEAINDKSGNPPAPGDDNATPVGKPDPNRDPSQTDTDAQKDAMEENPDAPGDKSGNPNSTGSPSAATELFGANDIKRTTNMPDIDIVKKWVSLHKDEMRSNTTAENKMKAAVGDWDDKDLSSKTGLTLQMKKFDGVPVVIVNRNDGGIEEVQYDVGSARFMTKSVTAMRKEIGKAMKNAPATEMEGWSEDTLSGFSSQVQLHKNRNLIPLQEEKDARDPSGNTGDPSKAKRTPVSPSGDTNVIDVDKFVKDSYSKDGNAGSPGTNGTPVSKSGDSSILAKNQFEKAADDKSGNPDSPGVNGDPVDKTFEGFLTAIEQLVIEDNPGTLRIPNNMSLESYAMELGMGEIAARAMEANLTAAERRALKDSDFGLPETRQWPLNDENHVRSAITNFHWCPQEKQKELAKNILKAMRKYCMTDVQVSEGNPFAKYCPDCKVVPRKKPTKKN